MKLGFIKFNLADYVTLKQENRIMHDGVNAKPRRAFATKVTVATT
ncbi:hypothetical protein LINPERPRIM_LOCUS32922 [Linum perenne]